MKTTLKGILGWILSWVLTVSTLVAAYQPSIALETKVDQVWDILINIISTKHDGQFDLLLWVLKQFESQVAGNEKKEWILNQLIMKTMKKQQINNDDHMMKDEMMEKDDPMMKDEMMWHQKTFDLTWKNFSFSETKIMVNKWDTVTINFESESWFHDRVVDEFNAATQQVQTWEKTSVTFVADTAWNFEYYCSVGSHRAQWMVGMLVVQDTHMMEKNMMDDTMMKEWIPLWHVAVWQTIRGISFDGSESAQGRLSITDQWATDLYVSFEGLPATWSDNFYEGRLVRKSPFHFISTGPLTMKDDMYVNEWMSTDNFADHNHYVLTLEPNDNDPAPAEHIFEGDL